MPELDIELPPINHALEEREGVKRRILQAFGHNFVESMSSAKTDLSNPCFNHEITEHLRYKMVDWMVEVTHAFGLDARTFFLSVAIMDQYL